MKASRLQRLVGLVSKLSNMQAKELWSSNVDKPFNSSLYNHWTNKEIKLRTLIFEQYERKSED